jgi:hypothetical protein
MENKKNPHAVALGRKGGQVKSAAKTATARENATRPRKKKAAQEKAAEAFAQEVMADEEFRRTLHEMIRQRSQALLAVLLAEEPTEKITKTRRR